VGFVDLQLYHGFVEVVFSSGDYSLVLKQESNLPLGIVYCCEVCLTFFTFLLLPPLPCCFYYLLPLASCLLPLFPLAPLLHLFYPITPYPPIHLHSSPYFFPGTPRVIGILLGWDIHNSSYLFRQCAFGNHPASKYGLVCGGTGAYGEKGKKARGKGARERNQG
jgi:hypothetical protein